jgi:hypothetical protein
LALGKDSGSYAIFYVDDIIVHSKTFEEHLIHLDTVTGKLCKAGFTINVPKCQFCMKEVKFLGHCISKTRVTADPERINSINVQGMLMLMQHRTCEWKCYSDILGVKTSESAIIISSCVL